MQYEKEKWNESALPNEKRIKRAPSSPSTSQCRDLLSFVYAKMFRIFVVNHDFSIFAWQWIPCNKQNLEPCARCSARQTESLLNTKNIITLIWKITMNKRKAHGSWPIEKKEEISPVNRCVRQIMKLITWSFVSSETGNNRKQKEDRKKMNPKYFESIWRQQRLEFGFNGEQKSNSNGTNDNFQYITWRYHKLNRCDA